MNTSFVTHFYNTFVIHVMKHIKKPKKYQNQDDYYYYYLLLLS